jgi:DeoR/GlpR family transcriptional regulator of sugar metabolism
VLRVARRERVLATVESSGFASYVELASELGVSMTTVRRDTARLAESGLLVEVRGGAGLRGRATARGEADVMTGGRLKAIARAAADMVEPGMCIGLLGDGAVVELATLLARRSKITVVTNSLRAATELWTSPVSGGPEVIVIGGEMNEGGESVGPLCIGTLSELHVDALFYGAQGFDVQTGYTAGGFLEADVVRAFARCARTVVATVDSGRWQRRGFVSAIPLSVANTLITDSDLPTAARESVMSAVQTATFVPASP